MAESELNKKRRVMNSKLSRPQNGNLTKPAGPFGVAPPVDSFDTGITLASLIQADLPPVRFVVDGLLPAGLSILVGRPKQGKSWLALLVAIAAHRGTTCLGALPDKPRDVLHLALEDTLRRYKDRAVMVLRAMNVKAGEKLDVRTSWPRAGKGGLVRLAEWFKDHPGGLVIVDTLARFRDPPSGRGSSYDDDYRAISELKALADQYEGAVLVIHHTRKGAAEDPFDEVSGTLGINGAADAIMVLDRHRGANTAALYITGRDLADQTLSLAWDGGNGLWSLTGRIDGIERPEKCASPNKVERCSRWLMALLTGFAWPDDEIIKAAVKSEFTEEDVKRAKVMLRKAEPPLSSKPKVFGGPWWNWIGPKNERCPDRTEAARLELFGGTTETT